MQVTETGSRGAGAMIIAKRAFDAAQEGRLSEFDLNTVMQEITRCYFDGDMSKMLDSQVGKIFLAPRTMRKSAAEEAELLAKRLPDRVGSGRQTVPSENGDGMDAIDWADDVQATKAYRAEKARKARESDQAVIPTRSINVRFRG
jgi:hypothetical protein